MNFMTVSSQLRVVSVVCLCLLVMMMSSDAAAQTYHSGQNVQPVFEGWEQRPCITAALVRSVDVAYAALRAGADGIIIFWTTLKEMMEHPLTDQWNQTFLDEWNTMHADGKLHGVPVVD